MKLLLRTLAKGLDEDVRQSRSRMTPGFGAQATSRMAMPFPEMGKEQAGDTVRMLAA